MDFFEILTHLFSLLIGGAVGSLLTFKIIKKHNQQNNNTVLNGSIVNGNYNNGNNNTNTHNNE
ncbi:hypothetical protein ACN6TW_11550 [Acinetobacter radioresistens]|uniref:Uncharacterized protein n=1 Tax=Acinetobacter radioresistens SK82 TaxID=596318 RepID=A0ABM9YM27_ACIRA|nr:MULTISPECIES: hypothetical protein [Acinetobacter]HAD80474.1 hypothetical protein [Flavobacteriaceae bacterium]EET82093.1 hypothetical protein ACIRA0001_0887 [Acinetobacter radioresistens SK82]EXE54393.1 hypothetical protein J579_3176 [Acinetobacter sp. 1239920]MCK4096574.1 hypothetical protein [Acinetobacter radioresistens]MCK4100531.1 hypothetical protein [Acinetobacter radioresistens]